MKTTDRMEQRKANSRLMAEAETLFAQLNDVWERLEDDIREFGILKPVSVPIDNNVYLGVQKRNGTWRICYGEETMTEGDIIWTPMSDTPFAVRTSNLSSVKYLYPAIVTANTEVVEELRNIVKGLV